MSTRVDWPVLPEGFDEDLDGFVRWLADNNFQSVDGEGVGDGASFSAQIGGTKPLPSAGIQLWFGPDSIERLTNGAYKPISDTPVGSIIMYPNGVSLPANYIWCEGQEVSRNDFPDLFDVIGTTFYQTGDDTTKFRLPDFTGRHPVGANRTSGTNGGAASEGEIGTYDRTGPEQFEGVKLRAKELGKYYGRHSPFNDSPYPDGPTTEGWTAAAFPNGLGTRLYEVIVNSEPAGRLVRPNVSRVTYAEPPSTAIKFLIRYR